MLFGVFMGENKRVFIVGLFSLSLGLSLFTLIQAPSSSREIKVIEKIVREPTSIEKETLKYFFYYESTKLRPESEAKIKLLVKLIEQNPKGHFEIHGHTDSKGSESYNLDLSRRRANVILDKLIEYGIDYRKIGLFYHGENSSALNKTESQRRNNRRIDFVVYKEGKHEL